MPTRNVNLTEHWDRFVQKGIKSGRFSNASEVVREGLRLLEQREKEDKARVAWLRAEGKVGLDAIERGDYIDLNSEQAIDDFLKDIHKQVSAEIADERKRV